MACHLYHLSMHWYISHLLCTFTTSFYFMVCKKSISITLKGANRLLNHRLFFCIFFIQIVKDEICSIYVLLQVLVIMYCYICISSHNICILCNYRRVKSWNGCVLFNVCKQSIWFHNCIISHSLITTNFIQLINNSF